MRRYAAFWSGYKPEELNAMDVFVFSAFPTLFALAALELTVGALIYLCS